MRFVMIAVAIMVVATVATTPKLRSQLADVVLASADSAARDRQAARVAISDIPGTVIARLPLPQEAIPETPEAETGPAREPAPPAAAAAGLNELAPAGGREARPADETPGTVQVASLPPIADPLHSGETTMLSDLMPAADAEAAIEATSENNWFAADEPQEAAPAPVRASAPRAAEAPSPESPPAAAVVKGRPRNVETPRRLARPQVATLAGETRAADPQASEPEDGRGHYVVIGSFLERARAQEALLRYDLWQPSVREAMVGDRTRLRVVVGPFARADLGAALETVRALAVPDAWPLSGPRDAKTAFKSPSLVRQRPDD